LAAEPHVSAGRVKITREAYNKTSNYRGVTRNQLLAQLSSFRVGDRAAYKRVDDLLDCATFAILLAFGDSVRGDGGFFQRLWVATLRMPWQTRGGSLRGAHPQPTGERSTQRPA
jgi:hypothetical protein